MNIKIRNCICSGLLVYCRSANRSKQAAKKLEALGYTGVIEIGGIMNWSGETE